MSLSSYQTSGYTHSKDIKVKIKVELNVFFIFFVKQSLLSNSWSDSDLTNVICVHEAAVHHLSDSEAKEREILNNTIKQPKYV